MLFAADWALALTGRDPAAAWRGTYCSKEEAIVIIHEAGGMMHLMHRALGLCGWAPAPGDEGDIALVRRSHHADPAAAVCVSRQRVALLTRRGLVVSHCPIMDAWRHG
jgi:hypothetical protein